MAMATTPTSHGGPSQPTMPAMGVHPPGAIAHPDEPPIGDPVILLRLYPHEFEHAVRAAQAKALADAKATAEASDKLRASQQEPIVSETGDWITAQTPNAPPTHHPSGVPGHGA